MGTLRFHVNEVAIDYSLVLAEAEGLSLRLEGPIELADSDHRLAWDDPGAKAWVESLLGAELLIVVDEDGSLRMHREDVPVGVVRPHEDYESWQWWNSDGSGAICMPGGQIASWGAR